MIQNAERKKTFLKSEQSHGDKSFTLFLNGSSGSILTAKTEKTEIKIPEKLLGFSKIEHLISKIYHLLFNESPQEIILVPIENASDDYVYGYPVVLITNSAHNYLKEHCSYNRMNG